MADEHLSDATIEQFVAGELSEAEEEAALFHMADCDECMARADALWQTQPTAVALDHAIQLDEDKARQMESKLVRRINRSNLGNSVVQFGIGGFSNVMLAMIRPFLSQNKSRRKGEDHD